MSSTISSIVNNIVKIHAKTAIACLLLSSPLFSHAQTNEIFQECLLEGKVVAHQAGDGKNVVRVDFYKAEPARPEARCIIDGVLEFKQPKGTLIEHLSEGSIVQYHYTRFVNGQTNWQLVGAFI